MRLTRFHLQAACVLGLMTIIGWPEFRQPARAVTVWRPNGPLTPRPELAAADQRIAYARPGAAAPSAAGTASPTAANPQIARGAAAGVRTAALESAGPRASITGRARTSLNQPVPYARVVLRNRVTGEIASRTTADEHGQFSFDNLRMDGYIVELIGMDGAVIAASELTLNSAGALQPAMLRVGLNAAPRALLGTSTATNASNPRAAFLSPTANEPIGRAAARGASQTTSPDADASPRN